jgi:alginate O-acetyltransferase complex protein AlgI
MQSAQAVFLRAGESSGPNHQDQIFMPFNSFAFAVFLPTVLLLYWALPKRGQNLLLLGASYFFYGYWDWRFLSLLAISTVVDYTAALRIEREHGGLDSTSRRRKKVWLLASLCTNLGLLGFFKYFNFFADSFAELLASLGLTVNPMYLSVVLPVGISFYTFQTMSYTIDVYRGRMPATRRFFDFALYVSFFPQLVAGPIERAAVLLPQILNHRCFSRVQFLDGTHLIFWGLFKKVFVADNLAPVADRIFAAGSCSAAETLLAAYAFAFQIYCDFSGYSDIARGCAKCMGFELMLNFDHPYVAENPREFWQRWHISLSTWLRDYLYIPLGGNRGGNLLMYRNLALTMLLGGLWHGAAWTFVIWGAYQGVLLIGHRIIETIRKPSPPIPEFMSSRFSPDPASEGDSIWNSGNQEGKEPLQHSPIHEFMSSRFSTDPASKRDAISNSGNQEGNEPQQHSPIHEFMSSRFSPDPAAKRDAISNSGNQEGNEPLQHSPIHEFMSSRFSPSPSPGNDLIWNSGNQEGGGGRILMGLVRRLLMFHLICVGWLIFRASSMGQVGGMLGAVVRMEGTLDWRMFMPLVSFVGPLVLVEGLWRVRKGAKRSIWGRLPLVVRCAIYAVLFYLLVFHGAVAQSFIYFQF